jgi:hypothetical protein
MLNQAALYARYLVIYISCGANTEFNEMFRAVALEIPLLYFADYGPTHPETERGGVLADLIPEGVVTARAAGNLLNKVVGTRVLIILDEFERVESEPFRHEVGELMKDLSDRAARVQIIVVGVAANLKELLENLPSIARNLYSLRVDKMTDDEVNEMVMLSSSASGVHFLEDSAEAVIRLAAGFPALASLIGHHACLEALENRRTTVELPDVSTALMITIGELKSQISKDALLVIADCEANGEKEALQILAAAAQAAGGRFSAHDIRQAAPNDVQAARAVGLAEKLAGETLFLLSSRETTGIYYRFDEQGVPAFLWLVSCADFARSNVVQIPA